MHDRYPSPGSVEWIGLTREKYAELESVQTAMARPHTGLDGDRHAASGRKGNKRQVTLIQAEHFPVMSALIGRPITPDMTRRNLVVRGINLYAMRFGRFRIGEVVLEGTGICAPCSRMEKILGEGGYNAMRGHGGICARVVEGGEITVGAQVAFVSGPAPVGKDAD